ncbi:MAG: hypothetical protein EOM31_09915 [Bacteroidia bacterium]|nr:hypothetical protein [Bacteroidia bacterium]
MSKPTNTLEDIQAEKRALSIEIKNQQKAILQSTKQLFAPAPEANSKVESLMHTVSCGMNAYDGFMTGLKLIKKLRRYFDSLTDQECPEAPQ